jgi:hypothetical protein
MFELEQELTARDVFELWNAERPAALPAVRIPSVLPKDRVKQIAARLEEYPHREDWIGAIRSLANWEFGLGEKGWRANFDWLISNKGRRAFEGAFLAPPPEEGPAFLPVDQRPLFVKKEEDGQDG